MTWLVCARRMAVAVCLGALLSGCLPSGHGQLDEEKESHYLAGKSRVSAMDYRGAIESFSKAIEVNPRSGAAHLELGWLFDQKESDPAAAIYHYNKYLQLRRNAPNAETIKTRILACKQELARTVSLGPVTQNLQREFEALVLTNKKLQEEVEKWRAYALLLQAQTNALRTTVPPERPTAYVPQPVVHDAPARPSTSSESSRTRTHVVKQGETLTQIAKRYGVRVDALQSANPGLNPNRMQIGENLRIP
jgi:LysM repeat protein